MSSVVICPSCGSQFMGRSNKETTCPKCGYPIPGVMFKPEPPSSKPTLAAGTASSASPPRERLTEFTDQPSPFMSSPRESRPQSNQKPSFVPFTQSGQSQSRPQQAKPFVSQNAPQPEQQPRLPAAATSVQARKPAPIPVAELDENGGFPSNSASMADAQARSKNLTPIGSLGGNKPVERPLVPSSSKPASSNRPVPAISIPKHDAIKDEQARPVQQGPSLSVENHKPTGSLSNPLQLRERQGLPASQPAVNVALASTTPRQQGGLATGGKDSLEKTMKRELESFKEKMDVLPKVPIPVKKAEPLTEKQGLPFKEPENLGDVLRDLIKIDPVIKASALVKRDGTILASAISSTLSDSLISIIATTVTTMGNDITFATDSGDLKYITFGGTSGIVHIMPVISEVFLIILTSATSKQGIISVISKQVEKGVKQYLNLS